MNKKKVSMYIAGGLVVAISVILLVFVTMIIAEHIHPRKIPLTLSTVSAEKAYDGTPLKAEEYKLKYGKLTKGHKLEVSFNSEQTMVGSCQNEITVHVVDEQDNDVSDLYTIEVLYGTLKVEPVILHITSGTQSKYYDGNPLKGTQYEITQGELPEGHTVSPRFYHVQERVGQVENTMHASILDSKGNDVSDQFQITYDFGTLSVYPRRLTISTPGHEKVYDGIPLIDETFTLEEGTVPAGHIMNIQVNGKQITVGESENGVNLNILDKNGNDVTDQFRITFRLGTLKVTPRKITIRSENLSRMYDGTPLKAEEYTVTNGHLAGGHYLKVEFYHSQLYVGECENAIKATVLNKKKVDVSDQYEITYIFGKLKVEKRLLTIASGSAEKVFDGKPLTNSECSLVNGKVANGEKIHYHCVGSQTLAGQTMNFVSAYVTDAEGKDMSNQYEFSYQAGTLTVTPRKISIKSADATKRYDGTPLSSSQWEILAGNVCEGHTMQVTTYGKQTEIGECDNQIVYVAVYDESSGKRVDVTGSYEILCYYGTLTVTMP